MSKRLAIAALLLAVVSAPVVAAVCGAVGACPMMPEVATADGTVASPSCHGAPLPEPVSEGTVPAGHVADCCDAPPAVQAAKDLATASPVVAGAVMVAPPPAPAAELPRPRPRPQPPPELFRLHASLLL